MSSTMIRVTEPRAAARTFVPARVLGGIGGLLFVAVVIVQNLIRASALPANDATANRVIEVYSQHRSTTVVLVVLFALSATGLAAFAGGLLGHVRSRAARGPLYAGLLGVAGIVGMFTITVGVDLTLSTYIDRGDPASGVVDALWILHNSAFTLLELWIGIALAGLSVAAVNHGLLGPRWRIVGVLGGLALIASAAMAPAIVNGSPVMAVGLVGFVAWLTFMARTSVALLKAVDA